MNIKKWFKPEAVSIPARASIAYFVSSVMLQGVSIITLPFFAKIMSTEQMGIVTLFTTWNSILGTVATLSLNSGVFSIAMIEFPDDRDRYQSSTLTLSSISSLFFGSLLILLYPYLANVINMPMPFILLMIAGFVVQPAFYYWIARQRFEYKYIASSIVTVASAVLSALAGVVLVYLGNSRGYANLAEIRIVAFSAVSYLFSLFFFVLILRRGKSFINTKYWKFALKLNVPLIIHTLAKQLFDVSDRLMIADMVGREQLGIYGVLSSVSSLSLIVWTAINASLIPYMFRNLAEATKNNDSNAISLNNRTVTPLLMLYAIICISLSLSAPEVVRILTTEEYYQAVYLVPPLAAGIFYTSLYSVYGNVLLFFKKTTAIMLSTLITATLKIIANYLLIPIYGYIAASYTSLVSFILLALIQMILSRSLHRKPLIDNKIVWTIAMITSVLCLVSILLYPWPVVRYLLLAAFTFALFTARRPLIKAIKASRDNTVSSGSES